MMKDKLSRRLQTLVGYIPPGKKIVDIGSDHGLIPVYLALNQISPKIIAVEYSREAANKLQAFIHSLNLASRIAVRLGDGFKVILPEDSIEIAVIAGLGGRATVRILQQASPAVFDSLKKLILQPMNNSGLVRDCLFKYGWHLEKEDLVLEKEKFYPIIVAAPDLSRQQSCSGLQQEIGPLLIKKKHPLLAAFLKQEIKRYELILESLARAEKNNASRKKEIIERISYLKQVVEDIAET